MKTNFFFFTKPKFEAFSWAAVNAEHVYGGVDAAADIIGRNTGAQDALRRNIQAWGVSMDGMADQSTGKYLRERRTEWDRRPHPAWKTSPGVLRRMCAYAGERQALRFGRQFPILLY